MRAALVVLAVAFAALFASASAWAAGQGFSWDNSSYVPPSPPLPQPSRQTTPTIATNTTISQPPALRSSTPFTTWGTGTDQSPRFTVTNNVFGVAGPVSVSVSRNPATGTQGFGVTVTPGGALRVGAYSNGDVCAGVGGSAGAGAFVSGAALGCVNLFNGDIAARQSWGLGRGIGAESASLGVGGGPTYREAIGNVLNFAPGASTPMPTSGIRGFQPGQTGSWFQRPAPALPIQWGNASAGNRTITTYHPSLNTSYSQIRSRTPN